MRTLITLLILITSTQITLGQACGIYQIHYVGEVVSESQNIVGVKLPSTFYLHSIEDKQSELDFFKAELDSNKLDIKIRSHLTSIYSNSEKLKETYKSKRNFIPITLISEDNGALTEKQININWDKVEIKQIKDEDFGSLFEINLGKIAW